MTNSRLLTTDALLEAIAAGEIDTVVVAFTDMQGRLQGKRLHAEFFLDHVLAARHRGVQLPAGRRRRDEHRPRLRDQFVGVRVRRHDLRPRPGHHPAARPPARHRDDPVRPDAGMDGTPVAQSPRTVLRAQVEPGRGAGLPGARRHRTGVHRLRRHLRGGVRRRLHRASPRPTSTTSTTRSSAPPASSRCCATSATPCTPPGSPSSRPRASATSASTRSPSGTPTRSPRPTTTRSTRTPPRRSPPSTGARITFMAKYNEREGNSCHIHLSLRGTDGSLAFWDSEAGGRSTLYDHFIAGVLATMADFTLLYAPNINSYKRFADGSFAPTTIAWGVDNRTCAVRLVGHGPSARMENRLPGGDVNPYLALARDAGRRPARHRARAGRWSRNWPATPTPRTSPRVPTDAAGCPRRLRRLGRSPGPRSATTSSTTTCTPPTPSWPRSTSAVTDWERRRGFERL